MNKKVCEAGAKVLGTGTVYLGFLLGMILTLGLGALLVMGVAYLASLLPLPPWTVYALPVAMGILMAVILGFGSYEFARETGWIHWYKTHCEEFWKTKEQ